MASKSKQIKNKDIDVVLENTQVKKQNKKAAEYLYDMAGSGISVSTNTADRVDCCAEFLKFLKGTKIHIKTNKDLGEGKVMTYGNFCGNRFCPVCSKNKARKDARVLDFALSYLKSEYEQEFVFLTLTVPNCKAKDLRNLTLRMNKAVSKLMKRKQFLNIVNGWVKKVEVTYNSNTKSKSYDTYHPHIHMLVSVDKDYFYNSKKYISHAKWLKAWQEVMKDPSINQVSVKKADKNAVLEMSKYMAKDSDYLHSKDVFETFYKSLKGLRLLTYSKNFKEAIEKYEGTKPEDDETRTALLTDELYQSHWKDDKVDYQNQIDKIANLTDFERDLLDSELHERGYSIAELDNGFYSVTYTGKRTYGSDTTDE